MSSTHVVAQAGAALVNIARTAPAARAVAQKQNSRRQGGTSSGKPGARLPIDLSAAAGLDVVLTRLRSWAGHPVGHGDPIVELAVRMMTWPVVSDWVPDVLASERIVVGIASGPDAYRYLGECHGDLYGREGAHEVRCDPCGTVYSQTDRIELLARMVRSHAFQASLISSVYGIKVGTIRSWASRGRLTPRDHDKDGRPLFLLADVLALANRS